MAENPGAISQGPGRGWGFVLDTNVGLNPLRTLQGVDQMKAARAALAARQKQAAVDKAGKFLTDPGQASLLYKEKEQQRTEAFFNAQAENLRRFKNNELDEGSFNLAVQQEQQKLKNWKDWTVRAATARDQFEVAFKDKTYQGEKLRELANQHFFDERGQLKDNPDPEFEVKVDAALNDPENWNKTEIAKQFSEAIQKRAVKTVNEHGTITDSLAVETKLPLYFDPRTGKPVQDPKTGNYQLDLDRTMPLVKGDPRLDRLINYELSKQDAAYQAAKALSAQVGEPMRVGEPTYKSVMNQVLNGHNPTDVETSRTIDEPSQSSIDRSNDRQLLMPRPTRRETNISRPVKSADGTFSDKPSDPYKNVSMGISVASKKGSNLVGYVELEGIAPTQISYTDGRRPDSKSTKSLNIKVDHIGYGLVSGNGTPLTGNNPDPLAAGKAYIDKHLNKPEDFKKVKVDWFLEGETYNKANVEGDINTESDINKEGVKSEKKDPTLNTKERVFAPLTADIRQKIATRTGLSVYNNPDNLRDEQMKALDQHYIQRYKAVMSGKIKPANPSTALPPHKQVAKSGNIR